MKKEKKLVLILMIVIVILLGFVIYTFIIRPAIDNYVIKGQYQGIEYTIASIMEKAATCQPVSLTFKNQTMNLIAIECFNSNNSFID